MDFYIDKIPYPVITAFGLIAAAAGFWRGGRDGTVVAVVVLVQIALAWSIDGFFPVLLAVALDAVTLAICFALVLTGRNHWTIVAAATQVLSVATQSLRFTIGLTTWGYYSAQTAWFLVLIASLLVGSVLTPGQARGAPR